MSLAMKTVTIDEAGRVLGVSTSTVWRMIRTGELPSFRARGRRRVPVAALHAKRSAKRSADVPRFTKDHPIFRLVGAGRSGGQLPGARDKHAILDR